MRPLHIPLYALYCLATMADPARGAPAQALPQFVAYCLRDGTLPAECAPGPGYEEWTEVLMVKLAMAKRTADVLISAEDDAPGNDVWEAFPSDGRGDCDDFAMTSRRLLVSWGVSPGAVRPLVVRTPAGELHLVLEAVTSRGSWVLDNLAPAPYPLEAMAHSPVMAATDRPLSWETLGSPVPELRTR